MSQDNSASFEAILPVLSRLSLKNGEGPLTNILTDIAKEDREHMLREYAEYIPLMFEACKHDSNPHIQQMAACAIGKYVEFGRETFKHHLRDGLSSLKAIIVSNAAIDDLEHSKARDAAVCAYGKLCFFLCEEINSSPDINMIECILFWLSQLPLKCNIDEAKAAHTLLCSMIDKPETKVTYMGRVVAVMTKVLWVGKNIATQDTRSKMIQQLKMLKQSIALFEFEAIHESMPPYLKNALDSYLSSSSYLKRKYDQGDVYHSWFEDEDSWFGDEVKRRKLMDDDTDLFLFLQ